MLYALTILDEDMGGKPDPDIASLCRNEKRILVTLDTDFANLRAYPPEDYPGIIVFRLEKQDKPFLLKIIKNVLDHFTYDQLNKHLWIVEEGRIRIRG